MHNDDDDDDDYADDDNSFLYRKSIQPPHTKFNAIHSHTTQSRNDSQRISGASNEQKGSLRIRMSAMKKEIVANERE